MSAISAELAALTAILGGWSTIGWAVFLRVGAAMALLPAFGSEMVPMRVRLSLAGAFTLIVAPLVAAAVPAPEPGFRALLALTATETLAGLALGFSIRLFVWILQVAGSVAAQAMSLSQLLGAQVIDPQPAMAQILVIAGFALAAIAGLHVRIAEALVLSYSALPMGLAVPPGQISLWAVGRVAVMFETAFTFAAPFVIASLVYNLALGVINRAMPQLMVAFVGAPAITGAGLLLLFLAAPVMLPFWLDLLAGRLADPFGGIR